MPNLFDGDLERFTQPAPPLLVVGQRHIAGQRPFLLQEHPETAVRIRARISLYNEHWICSGALAGRPGRPVIRVDGDQQYIARLLWESANRESLGGRNLRNPCQEPLCVRPHPDHNRAGPLPMTPDLPEIDFSDDTMRIGRPGRPKQVRCKRGHVIQEIPNRNGNIRRHCRPCDTLRRREYERKRTARAKEARLIVASQMHDQKSPPVELDLPLLRVVR